MYHLFLAFISIFICYKYGDWKNWKIYYPTILFLILSNVVCTILIYNHPFWFYEWKILGHTFCDLFICITVYPSTIILLFTNFPKKPSKIITRILFYIAIFTIGELIGFKLGYFSYRNGWNIWYSLIFNFIMFPILILHYNKPLYAWLIALISPHILFFLLQIPYSSIR
ncbi:CBO0543 family protein [Clostridium algoriphilum]|uniref:CBO0543 family protein n=1 Tax=Clostridium algoriphilum TaxID=198347 RepID=UPI00384D345E